MALVTIQRSPSPSTTEHDLDTIGSSEDGVDGRSSSIKRRSKSCREKLRKIVRSIHFITKLRPCLSDSYFTVKGAALILPNHEYSKKPSRKSHGGEIQGHLQAMLHLLRPADKIKIAVRLEDVVGSKYRRYVALVSTLGRQDTEEAVILGIDCDRGEAHIRLVLPVWLGVKLRLGGDGGFSLITDQQSYLFSPVSVQALWSAIQSLVKVLHTAEEKKYLQEGLTHTWVDYYRGQITRDLNPNSHWNVEGVEVFAPTVLSLADDESESVKHTITSYLREIMMKMDLEETTSKMLRLAVEEKIGMSLKHNRSYFDEEVMRILGQMDAPSQILDYLYLGSEWNASNLDELKTLGIGYILNITQEIDNFFSGMFQYFTVRLPDIEESDLLRHWDKTYKFISKARDHGSKVLVHCKMGISRSASSVMAYLMKFNRWSVDEAYEFVKARRSIVCPNSGFMEQLEMYEAILSASNKRDIFCVRSDKDLMQEESGGIKGEEENGDECQGFLLGDCLFNAMSATEFPSLEEEWLRCNIHAEPGLVQIETDLETMETRSGDSIEEAHPDIPSPLTCAGMAAGFPATTSFLTQNSGDATVDAGLPSRIKPDSSWIKMEAANEMDVEGNGSEMTAISEEWSNDEGQIGSTSVDALQSLPGSSIIHDIRTSPRQGSYANDGSNVRPPSATHLPSQSMLAGGISDNVNNLQKYPPVNPQPFSQMTLSDRNSAQMDMVEMDVTSSCSSTTLLPQQHMTDNDSTSRSTLSFDQNQNLSTEEDLRSSDDATTVLNSVSRNSEDSISESTSPFFPLDNASSPSKTGRVEVGVREYFFREKIPWHPGKVQKIREGINRTGNLLSNASEESSSLEMSSPGDEEAEEFMAVDVGSAEEGHTTGDGSAVGFDDKALIMATSIEGESGMEDNSVSLYDKEDIPLEPGTVLRTRMEIEERQRSWCENAETCQSKPVTRTSSLKHTNDPSRLSEGSKRRVSCGPDISHGPMKTTEIIMPMKEELTLESADPDEEQMSDVFTSSPFKEVERPKETDVLVSDALPVSLQAFGDDITIESGLVRKHKMEIETKKDGRPSRSNISSVSMEPESSSHHSTGIPQTEMDQSHEATVASSLFMAQNDPEQQNLEEGLESEQHQDGSDSSNKVKFFVSKIEKHRQGQSEDIRKIVILETPTALPNVGSEDQRLHSETLNREEKLDLGFTVGESSSDDVPLISPSSKFPTHGAGEGCEPSVVRHLVDRFEVRGPEECSADAFSYSKEEMEKYKHHLSSSSKPFPSSSSKVEEVNWTSSPPHLPSSSSAKSTLVHKELTEMGTNIEHHPEALRIKSAPKAAGSQDSEMMNAVTGSWPPRIRPRSAGDVKEMQGDDVDSAELRHSGGFEGGKSGGSSFLRQVSDEGRKIRKLHGKSHPLSRLAPAQSQRTETRGSPFHSSM